MQRITPSENNIEVSKENIIKSSILTAGEQAKLTPDVVLILTDLFCFPMQT